MVKTHLHTIEEVREHLDFLEKDIQDHLDRICYFPLSIKTMDKIQTLKIELNVIKCLNDMVKQ